MKKIFRAIIIDDERLARQEMHRILKDFPEVQIVGEASGISEAVRQIHKFNPDLLFLDIQLRAESGFDLLDKIDFKGHIIFVTAFDRYAVRAFEVNALDYLLKPVEKERLSQSIRKLGQKHSSLNPSEHSLDGPEDMIFLEFNNSFRFVRLGNILKIVADGSYSKIYLTDGAFCMMSKPLKYWEERLPEKFFIRAHRSIIVNVEHINNIKETPNYSYKLILSQTGEEIVASRRYSIKLRDRFK